MHKSCRNRPLKSDGFQARNPRDSSSPIFRGKNLLRFREGTPLTSPNDIGFLPLFVPHICSPIFPFPESFRDSPCFTPPSPWTTPGALRESLRVSYRSWSSAIASACRCRTFKSCSERITQRRGRSWWSWRLASKRRRTRSLEGCSLGMFFFPEQ